MSTDETQEAVREAETIAETQLYAEACEDGQAYLATQPSLEAAWDNCKRADWMVWALGKIGWSDTKMLVMFACWCCRETPLADGRKMWNLLTDERSRNAVEVTERWTRGEATREELDAARAVARAAADAAYTAAADAAGAAANAAYAAYTVADAAADVAAYAASDAAAAADVVADVAADAAARESQADHLRVMIPNPFTGDEARHDD